MASGPAPVALFVYNRLHHARRVMDALKANELACDTDVVVFSDGPKSESDADKIEVVRKYVKSVSGFSSVRVVERDSNAGLGGSITAGVAEVVGEYGRVVVLEDDILTSRYFLRFMNDALDFYENEGRVVAVGGYLPPVKRQMPENFLLKFFDCWGWATWKRGWDLFEPDSKKLLKELRRRGMEQEFNFNNAFNFSRLLEEGAGWAVRFYASMSLNDRLGLYPGASLVNNIGWDGTGVHCGVTSAYDTKVSGRPVALRRVEVEENLFARRQYEEFLKSLGRRSLADKLFDRVKHHFLR